MKYSTDEVLKIIAILVTLGLLYLTIQELRVAFSGFSASAQTVPCSTAAPTPSNPPSATPSATPTPSPSPTPTTTPSPSPSPTPDLTSTIFLTEFMACPESGNEWIELYNANPTTITISDWYVIDAANNKKLLNGTIAPHSFTTFEWSGSLLNNAGDSFKLQTDSGHILIEVTYQGCTTGISFVYEDGEWVGALASPNQATQTSETTYQTATRSAAQVANLSDDNHALTSLLTSFDTAVSELTAPHLALSHTLPSSSLSPTAPSLPSPTANTAPQPAKSTVPAISVILGGILQLATGSYALYESYFKNHV